MIAPAQGGSEKRRMKGGEEHCDLEREEVAEFCVHLEHRNPMISHGNGNGDVDLNRCYVPFGCGVYLAIRPEDSGST
jgi:hypothetical protein